MLIHGSEVLHILANPIISNKTIKSTLPSSLSLKLAVCGQRHNWKAYSIIQFSGEEGLHDTPSYHTSHMRNISSLQLLNAIVKFILLLKDIKIFFRTLTSAFIFKIFHEY
jgi:hypothetical protein